MNCEETRRALQESLDGVSLPEEARVHVRGCPDCRAHGEELAAVDSLLAAEPELSWSESQTAAVLVRLRRDRWARRGAGLAAAAVLLLSTWLGVGLVPVPAGLAAVGGGVTERLALPATPREAVERAAGGLAALFDSGLGAVRTVLSSPGLPVAAGAILALLALNLVVAGRLRFAGRRS